MVVAWQGVAIGTRHSDDWFSKIVILQAFDTEVSYLGPHWAPKLNTLKPAALKWARAPVYYTIRNANGIGLVKGARLATVIELTRLIHCAGSAGSPVRHLLRTWEERAWPPSLHKRLGRSPYAVTVARMPWRVYTFRITLIISPVTRNNTHHC